MGLSAKWISGVLHFFEKSTGTSVITIDPAGDVELITGQFLKGTRFQVTFPNIAAADVAKAFFVAPAACKIKSAYETHGTVCDAGDTMTIEKCNTGKDAGAGDVVLAAAWALNSTANTPVSKAAVTDGKESLVAGDSLMLKFATGDGTNYAEGCVTCTMEWL